jgi:hypothetical protein
MRDLRDANILSSSSETREKPTKTSLYVLSRIESRSCSDRSSLNRARNASIGLISRDLVAFHRIGYS